jgi:hypothetical protein
VAADQELVADATVEARRFLARVKPRTLKTDKGRVVTTAELAEALVRRAEIEHAVVEGTRPREILCVDCKAVAIKLASRGKPSKRCDKCREARRLELRRKREHDGDLAKLQKRRAYYAATVDRRRAETRAYAARNKEKTAAKAKERRARMKGDSGKELLR